MAYRVAVYVTGTATLKTTHDYEGAARSCATRVSDHRQINPDAGSPDHPSSLFRRRRNMPLTALHQAVDRLSRTCIDLTGVELV